MAFMDAFASIVGTLMQESLRDHIRVQSMEDHQTLVLKDASLVSMIAVPGALRMMDDDDVEDMVEQLRITLSPYLSQPGHVLDFTFIRDAATAQEDIDRLVSRTGRNARALGVDIDDILDERRRVLKGYMVAETLLLSVFTRPDVLSREEMQEARGAQKKAIAGIPVMVDAHGVGIVMESVFIKHKSVVEAVNAALRKVGQISAILDIEIMLQEMRAALYPDTASERRAWSPRLPRWAQRGENKSRGPFVMMPETDSQMSGVDAGHLFEPGFDLQLATEDAVIENSRAVRIGNRIFSSFDMTLAPETLPRFNDLVSDVTARNRNTPWRASLRIEAGGLHSQALKKTFLAIFAFSAPTGNKRILNAIEDLREIDGQIDTVVRFRMSFSTWSSNRDTLRQNYQTLLGAVQRWGNSRADGISGDPLATTVATVPGVTMASTAPVAAAPVRDALAMAPLTRQASPWSYGSLLLRTDDGRMWPFQPGSSLQTTWVTLIVGTPGSGKSVLMNALNFGSAITPPVAGGKTPELPRIAMIDIGPSSSGLISLMREALPVERRHEVEFRQLRMSRDDAINVFDLQLGMRRPLSNERQFLINFLALVCGDGINPINSAMRGLLTACVDRVYEDFSDQKAPRRYLPGVSPQVDEAMAAEGIETHEETFWWEIVDALAAAGRYHDAEVAQRYAVPTLADLVTASQTDQIASLYGEVNDPETGQPLLDAMQRMVSEVVRDYEILSNHTAFSLGSARVVSLDLAHVTPGGKSATAQKQTSLMYMLARQVLTRDYFLSEKEFQSRVADGTLPEVHKAYHIERARASAYLPKILCYDEFHRTGNIESICQQVLQDAREGRKFNVDIKLASQLITDFPKDIIEVSTGIIVCNAGSESSVEYLDSVITLSDADKRVMRTALNGPSSRGAPFWAMWKLKGQGQVRQKLTLTLGPAEIWAFSTTAQDVALRTRLYETLGPRLARRVLGRRFPGGSAEGEIKSRVARMEDEGHRYGDEARADIVGGLMEDLKSQALMLDDHTEPQKGQTS